MSTKPFFHARSKLLTNFPEALSKLIMTLIKEQHNTLFNFKVTITFSRDNFYDSAINMCGISEFLFHLRYYVFQVKNTIKQIFMLIFYCSCD